MAWITRSGVTRGGRQAVVLGVQATTLLSVVSGAVVVAALSSSVVQLQSAAVVVQRAAAVPDLAVPAAAAVPARRATSVGLVAAPAQPAYVAVSSGSLALSKDTSGGSTVARVDVLACTTAWSETGECVGRQSALLRDVVVGAVQSAVPVPAGTSHLRVSVRSGAVAVGAGRGGVRLSRP